MNRTALSLRALIVTGVLLGESVASAQYGEPRGGPPNASSAASAAAQPVPVEQALAAPADPEVELRLQLNAELAALTAQRQKISLAGPLTLMIGGGAVAAIGLALIVMSTGVHGDGDASTRRIGLGGIIVGVIGLGLGGVWLAAVRPERRRLGLRIKELRRVIELLGGVGPDRASLGMRVRF